MQAADTEAFRAALRDYRGLLERGYPHRALLALVGNRYELTREQRTILARGVCTRRVASSRRRKRTRRLDSRRVCVDCFNVLFTVSSYLAGRPLFVGTDGFLRDAAEDHGKSQGGDFVERATRMVLEQAFRSRVRELCFYLDAPVAYSGRTAELLRASMAGMGMAGEAVVTRSADFELKRVRDGLVATSDSAVIDASLVQVVDLARLTLEARYRPRLLRLDGWHPLRALRMRLGS